MKAIKSGVIAIVVFGLGLFFTFLGMFSSICLSESTPRKCVQLFYDRAPSVSPRYYFGRIHTIYLQNLVSHFPEIQQYIIPIESYQKKQLERCQANIYLGTYYNNPIPKDFLDDFISSQQNVLWAGYNIWQLQPENLESLWGIHFRGISTLDWEHLDDKQKPSFFKYYEYRGQRFVKYGEFDREDPKKFNATYEISLFDFISHSTAQQNAVAWAEHSYTKEKVPYVIRDKNHWYIGDSPFSYATEKDRYLIMTDLLFDLLEEQPIYRGSRPALVRLEDVHPLVPVWQLYKYHGLFESLNIPFTLSVIPIFTDPFLVTVYDPKNRFVPLMDKTPFAEFMKSAEAGLGSVIIHGVTHQYGTFKNPFSAVSGDDFEFWDRVHNKPIELDSPEFVISRLETGIKLFNQITITPSAWLTPHYQASPLDYMLFARLFSWTIGRNIYFPIKLGDFPELPEEMKMNRAGSLPDGVRLKYFNELKVDFPTGLAPSGQFVPYEIFGDYYDQSLIPENLGNVQPYMTEQVYATQSIEEILENAKRNLALRDHWGSFFIHPFLLQRRMDEGLGVFPGDVTQIQSLLKGIQELGYQFIDLKHWIKTHPPVKRPKPIEVTIEP